MSRLTEQKVVLIVRETRLGELKARFNTAGQAKFYIEQQGGDFADYEQEDAAYQQALAETQSAISAVGRLQIVHRSFLPNFMFGPDDLVVALGQDGVVANTLKYLEGQLLVGVNPDPARYDGPLLPFAVRDLPRILPEAIRGQRPVRSVTMAEARLNNGQRLFAVNDLFIGPRSHGSARYTIAHGDRTERHSSSGLIISTGLGSSGWFTSLITGALGVAASFTGRPATAASAENVRFPWDAPQLCFTVREPFPSRTSKASLVFGQIRRETPLILESHMPERGVIFSDGIEADYLEFNAGTRAEIRIADREGRVVA